MTQTDAHRVVLYTIESYLEYLLSGFVLLSFCDYVILSETKNLFLLSIMRCFTTVQHDSERRYLLKYIKLDILRLVILSETKNLFSLSYYEMLHDRSA